MRRLVPRPTPRGGHRGDRSGIAVTELAICLPILLLICFSLIELTSLIFVKQGLSIAAYEGAHRAVQPAATAADAIASAQEILSQRRIVGGTVLVAPADLPGVPAGQFFTVTVTAPAGPNCIAVFRSFASTSLSSRVSAMKETDAR